MISIDAFEPLRLRRSRIDKLTDKVQALENRRAELQRAIAGYSAFELDIEKDKIDNLEITAANLSRQIADQDVNKVNLERQLQLANTAKASPLAVWEYFTALQKKIRAEVSRLAVQLSSAKQQLSRDQEALSKVRADINATRKRLVDYENFDLNCHEKWLSSLGPDIERLKTERAAENDELMRLETKIRPHATELDRLKSERSNLMADIARANRFEEELSSASNSYERAMVHKQCEEEFGTGRPKQVINDYRKKIRSLENNIPKLERRIRDELQKLERTIGHLLIDGNNVCYDGGTFIGLRAISALLQELGSRYKTTVVFDASIREMLKTDTRGIGRKLGKSVNTHVAPTKTTADEYLLKLADQNNSAYILSNDRFAEYHDYSVVKSGRVFRFLAAEGKLMINDLDISVNF